MKQPFLLFQFVGEFLVWDKGGSLGEDLREEFVDSYDFCGRGKEEEGRKKRDCCPDRAILFEEEEEEGEEKEKEKVPLWPVLIRSRIRQFYILHGCP